MGEEAPRCVASSVLRASQCQAIGRKCFALSLARWTRVSYQFPIRGDPVLSPEVVFPGTVLRKNTKHCQGTC